MKNQARLLTTTPTTPSAKILPPHLPLDVIHRVLDLAYYDDNFEPDRKLLARCSLVCKDWSLPSQSLLFKHVQLRTQSAFESFSAAVNHDSEKGRHLANSIARLHVLLDFGNADALSISSFVAAVHLSSAMFELEVSIFGRGARREDDAWIVDAGADQTPSFDADILAMLCCGPQISALRVNNWSGNDQLALQLLCVWPTLSSVHLTGLAPAVRSPESPDETIAPFPCNLREAHLSFQSSPTLSFATWLLLNSSQSLRVLHLEREVSPDLSKFLISQHKSTLSSLTLHACTNPGLASLIQDCEELEELQFMDPHVSPLLLKKLPRALKHLAFAIDRNTLLHAAVDGLRAMKTLRRITIDVCPGGRVHPSMPGLKVACATNGITLSRTSSARAFHALVRGDPLPVTTFPRTKNVTNLKTMLAISRSKDFAAAAASPRSVASLNVESLAACGTLPPTVDLSMELKDSTKPASALVMV
ncbi:hypothetical protein SCHPADRAFT_912329 [Schizopora paradoxa]|uniref:F-box domain-containing protein n=1 Tax=Schizopora paradoxa TaxID=27342 RepID=A0A0H2S7C6_9AGAM|nr:hypothetical protein SCHPADRAFT_912329 [Schizopora paradoxa]